MALRGCNEARAGAHTPLHVLGPGRAQARRIADVEHPHLPSGEVGGARAGRVAIVAPLQLLVAQSGAMRAYRDVMELVKGLRQARRLRPDTGTTVRPAHLAT